VSGAPDLPTVARPSHAGHSGSVERYGQWFLAGPAVREEDRYVAYYGIDGPGPVYPEITAYAISMACVWFRLTRDPRYLERARRCAEFMVRISRPGVPGPDDSRSYLFDTGILAAGLLDLFRVTGEDWLRDAAVTRLDWMLERFDGRSFPATVPEAAVPHAQWHERRSVHLGKLALPLLKGWRLTAGRSYHDAARGLLDWALSLQEPDGRFRITDSERATMTHPHCYVTEALVYAAKVLQDSRLEEAASRATDWLSAVQNPDGSLYKWYGAGGRSLGARGPLPAVVRTKVSDATAQSLRLWRVLGVHEGEARRAEGYLRSREGADGSLPNHTRSMIGLDWRQRRIYVWPTLFWHHAAVLEFGETAGLEEMF
jgi:DUF1680 family protein